MADEGFLELILLDIEGNPIVDDEIRIDFFDLPGDRLLARENNQTLPHTYKLPAFPATKFVRAEITPSRYHFVNTPPVSLKDGVTKTWEMKTPRRPGGNKWRVSFTRWAQLSPHFQALKTVLEASPNLRVKEGGANLGLFTGVAYDNAVIEDTILAKTCLLNLYAKLTELKEPGGESWFSFTREVLVIGQERFIAVVDSRMGDIVRDIKRNLSHFPFYKNTPAQNHFDNFPAACQINKNKMFSLKSDEDNANIQLTLAPGVHPFTGTEILLLDADIDEHSNPFAHFVDLLKHKFNGGTHPIDIHEYLQVSGSRHHGQSLGYKLV
jgi:hypothetical protein